MQMLKNQFFVHLFLTKYLPDPLIDRSLPQNATPLRINPFIDFKTFIDKISFLIDRSPPQNAPSELMSMLLTTFMLLCTISAAQQNFPRVLITYHLSFDNAPWSGWNHHVYEKKGTSWPKGAKWQPPKDICSSYYPAQGLYR